MNREKLLISTLLFAFLSALIVGCAMVTEARGTDDTTAPIVDLEGTSWTLVLLGDENVLPEGAPTLRFVEGKVQGNATCNGYFGSFEREGSDLSFGPLGSTMMACPGMEQETAYFKAMDEVTSYRVEGDRLVLSNGDEDLLSFDPTPAPSLEGTNWKLVSLNTGSAMVSVLNGTEITALFDGEKVGGSAGCNRYSGAATVDGDAIEVGPVAGARMFCGEPEGVMDQENAYMLALGTAARFEVEGQMLSVWDGEGTRVLVFTAETK